MMRISVMESTSQVVALRLEGEVRGGWVEALRQSCDGILVEGAELTLDLAGVSFIDHDGVALFLLVRSGEQILELLFGLIQDIVLNLRD